MGRKEWLIDIRYWTVCTWYKILDSTPTITRESKIKSKSSDKSDSITRRLIEIFLTYIPVGKKQSHNSVLHKIVSITWEIHYQKDPIRSRERDETNRSITIIVKPLILYRDWIKWINQSRGPNSSYYRQHTLTLKVFQHTLTFTGFLVN